MLIHEIIRELMGVDMVVGNNATDLARRTGIPQPTLRNILNGTTSKPRTSTLETLAQYYGITLPQIKGHVPINYDEVKRHLLPELPRTTMELDAKLLAGIIETVEQSLNDNNLTLTAEKKACIIQMMYSNYIKQSDSNIDTTQVKSLINLAS